MLSDTVNRPLTGLCFVSTRSSLHTLNFILVRLDGNGCKLERVNERHDTFFSFFFPLPAILESESGMEGFALSIDFRMLVDVMGFVTGGLVGRIVVVDHLWRVNLSLDRYGFGGRITLQLFKILENRIWIDRGYNLRSSSEDLSTRNRC